MGLGEVGWYIHPKGENSLAVCGFGYKKSLCRAIAPHRAMQCSSVVD